MNQPVSLARQARQRLLVIFLFTAVLVIFSYGWTVTDIDLAVPQEPQRQQNVGNALRELLSPNIFTQEYEVIATTTTFVITCPDEFSPPPVVESDKPYIRVEPACGRAGEPITVYGYNFAPNGLARMNWIATDGERQIRQVNGKDNFITDPDGNFVVTIDVPRIRGTSGQTHTIEAQGRIPIGLPTLSETTYLVLEKMVETIFLALIATAVSILPSAILSFLAAHNLMRPVRMPLGVLLVGFVLLPIGWLLGTTLYSLLGTLALNMGSGRILNGAVASIVLVIGTVASMPRIRRDNSVPQLPLRAVASTLLVSVVGVLVIGFIGGLGILFGNTFREGIIGYVGTFIGSLGQMIELAMTPLCGVIGAFTIASIGIGLSRNILKSMSIPLSHIAGAILGALAGAILLGFMALIGMSAAWLGLFTPIVAGGLGSAILPQLYQRLGPKAKPSKTQVYFNKLLSWVSMLAGFVLTFSLLNVQQSLVEGVLPPQTIAALPLGITIYNYVWQAMLIGALLGGLNGALAGTKTNFPFGSVLYNVTRTLLNALRSIEPLIMGLIFVIWVGIGPFAGVLALALHSIASLGKLYSEQIENIDEGPIEALQSTGANRLQAIMYAVVPQIIPPYIAFTMYRWDINVRMSTIIGFVGGGGVGFLLQQQINLLRYRDAGVAVLAIAIVVSILDYASASIRERYI